MENDMDSKEEEIRKDKLASLNNKMEMEINIFPEEEKH